MALVTEYSLHIYSERGLILFTIKIKLETFETNDLNSLFNKPNNLPEIEILGMTLICSSTPQQLVQLKVSKKKKFLLRLVKPSVIWKRR